MYIKAKYPVVGNDFVGRQGYDSTYVDESQQNETTDKVTDKPYKFKQMKYPTIGNEYVGYQGFGSLNGGNTISHILSNITDRTITKVSTGYMFGGQKLNVINYSGSINTIVFTNESPEWISDQSASIIVEINDVRLTGTLVWDSVSSVWNLTFTNWNN